MYENIQRGEYLVGGKAMYFRSKWEANYALYLEFQKKQKVIRDWHYESKFFDFPAISHGTTRYLPDFEIEENDGTTSYVEVKGYMDSRSKTKLRRMAKYYPQVKLILVQKAEMQALNKWKKLLKFY